MITRLQLCPFSWRLHYFTMLSDALCPQVCCSCSARRVGFPPESSQSCERIRRGNTGHVDRGPERGTSLAFSSIPGGSSSPGWREENASSFPWRGTFLQLQNPTECSKTCQSSKSHLKSDIWWVQSCIRAISSRAAPPTPPSEPKKRSFTPGASAAASTRHR